MLLETLQELVHDSELFYDQLLEIGTPDPEYNIREQTFYTPGCQSNVWIKQDGDNILVDSDAYLVRGIARVLVDYANNNDKISMSDFHSIARPLTVQRQRGMQAIINKIREFKGYEVVIPSQQRSS